MSILPLVLILIFVLAADQASGRKLGMWPALFVAVAAFIVLVICMGVSTYVTLLCVCAHVFVRMCARLFARTGK